MKRKAPFVENELYHIYNRGVDKRVIFLDSHDHNRFMVLLYLCNQKNAVDIEKQLREGRSFPELWSIDAPTEKLVDIGAYCLMPNHFHLLIKVKKDDGITNFMRKLSTGYSMYFNKKRDRSGGLFEGRFKAKHIDNEPYLNYLFSYIHLNPVKLTDPAWKEKGIAEPDTARKFMENYKYSSYPDYFMGNRSESVILSKDVFPEHFAQLNDFKDLVEEFSSFKETIENDLNKVQP